MHLLLDGTAAAPGYEVAPVLVVLAPPHELGVEVGVARVPDFFSAACSGSRTDWCSAVGMFRRLSLGCRSVSTFLRELGAFFGTCSSFLAELRVEDTDQGLQLLEEPPTTAAGAESTSMPGSLVVCLSWA